MTDNIRDWLTTLELEHWGDVFEANHVALRDVALLTDNDLKDLGLPLGPRRRIANAAAMLGAISAIEPKVGEYPISKVEERRLLTIMFCDLVGSTELSQRLDPEILRNVMRLYQDAVVGAITQYGGHVAKFLGDGVLAYFGWPRAYEDQAERAVRAALDAARAVRTIEQPGGGVLSARLGIATGQVVVGDLEGDAALEEQAVTGQTPNLAARLQGVAEPGQVVIGATTHRLVGANFAMQDLGLHLLKGFAEPVAAWQVTGEGGAESRFEAAHGPHLGPIFGRGHELSVLQQSWQAAKEGAGQVVLLSGEAGIGKSRLALALREHIADQAHFHLGFQCSAHHTNTGLYPVIQRLERTARFAPEDTDSQKRAKLDNLLRLGSEDITETGPLLAALMSLPEEGRSPSPGQTAQQRRKNTIAALNQQLIDLSRQQPVLFCLEDAHWIDPTTEALLIETMALIQAAPVLMLITHRPSYTFPVRNFPNLISMDLNRLDRAESLEIAASIGSGVLPRQMIEGIAERADGIPLYIEELTKSVLEAETSGNDGVDGGAIEAIPTSLQASLIARLDRLGSAREVVQIGAVIGRSFPYDLAAAVLGGSHAASQAALERAVDAELISCRGIPPEAIYSFKHSLVQDTAYETLLRSTCQRYHGRVADVLLHEFPARALAEPEVVARHFSAGKQPRKAVDHWFEAGQRANERSELVEAVSNLRQGLSELLQLEEGPVRSEQELDFRLALGASLLAVEGWSAASVEANYQRAYVLSQSSDDSAKKVNVLRGLGNVFFLKGEVGKSRELAQRQLSIALAEDNRDLAMGGYRSVGMCSFFTGDFSAALADLQRANEIYDPASHGMQKFSQGTDPAVIGLSMTAWVHWFLGDGAAARDNIHQALAHGDAIQHPFSQAYAHGLAASMFQFCREPDATRQHAEAAIALARQNDYPYWFGWAKVMQGWAMAALGDGEEGLAILQVSTPE
ncbi:MAG: AAA family ATPase [Rhodospirillaceae bacterium]|nr:AAA family ATPase [Rhodospirillaceae bacterium]